MHFDKPLVSVIMPTYNAEKHIGKAIQSMLNQTYENIELLITDDFSSDDTLKVIKAFSDPRIKVFENKKNIGSLQTRNRLLSEVKGKYIAFQDADDWSDSRRLEKQWEAFAQDANLFLCGTNYTIVSKNLKHHTVACKPLTYTDIKKVCHHQNPICFATSFFKAEVLETVGGFREYFNRIGSYDTDWIYRIIEKYKVINLPDPLYNYWQNPSSSSKRTDDTFKSLVSNKIVFLLAQERKRGMLDAIERNDTAALDVEFKKLTEKYRNDSSLLHRERASGNMYVRNYADAIINSLKAIVANPYMLINYKTLGYCIKKMIYSHVWYSRTSKQKQGRSKVR